MANKRWKARVGIQYRFKDPRDGQWKFRTTKKKGPKPEGCQYFLRFTDEHSQRKREPLRKGCSYEEALDKAEIKAFEIDCRIRGVLPENPAEPVGTSVADAIPAFLKKKAAKTPRTVKAYTHDLKKFQESLSPRVKRLEDIDDAVLQHFQEHTLSEGYSPKTLANRLMTVALFLKESGSAAKVNWKNTPKVAEQPARDFPEDELEKLFAAFDAEEKFIFAFFLGTGCREQEVSHAEWSDINWVDHTHTVQSKPRWKFKTKNHMARTVPIPAELVKALKEWKKQADANCTLLFPSSKCKPNGHFLRYLKAAAKRAGLNCGKCVSTIKGKEHTCDQGPYCERYKLHSFRKTFATRLHRLGAALKDLQEWLGHESLETTQIYLGSSDVRSTHVRNVVDKAFSF